MQFKKTHFLFGAFILFWIVTWNFQTFSGLLRRATLQLEPDQLLLRLFPQWGIRISLSDLDNVRIRQHTIPKYRVFGAGIGFNMHIYFISSPGLPWYFQFVGQFAHKSFKGRGFFITSRHSHYELFLEQMKRYEIV